MFTLKSITAQKTQKLSKLVLDNIQGLSYSALQKLFRQRDIKVNGKRVSADLTVTAGDTVDVYYVQTEISPFTIVFEDDNVVVIDKKSGYSSEVAFERLKSTHSTAGFIHRLDRNTAGLMIFSLNAKAEQELLHGFKTRVFDKKYLATVYGTPSSKSAILTAYLLKDAENSTVKIFDTAVKGATQIRTGYEVISTDGKTSVLEVTLYTGKTHQIRAHLAHIGHFVIGDGKYGNNQFNKSMGAKAQLLRAYKLTLKFSPTDSLYYLNGKSFILD